MRLFGPPPEGGGSLKANVPVRQHNFGFQFTSHYKSWSLRSIPAVGSIYKGLFVFSTTQPEARAGILALNEALNYMRQMATTDKHSNKAKMACLPAAWRVREGE